MESLQYTFRTKDGIYLGSCYGYTPKEAAAAYFICHGIKVEKVEEDGDKFDIHANGKVFSMEKTYVSPNKLVTMRATFTTDGNWDEPRHRDVNERMLPEKILKADTLDEAIEYFQSQVNYVDSIKEFKYFKIEDKKYESDYWGKE